MAAILEGVRVISWTVGVTGPMAASILGDMGADVIKVEDPRSGDLARTLTRTGGVDTTMPWGSSITWEKSNRNTRGIAIDLKAEKGREIMTRLVESADALIQNYRSGVAERLGMDYATLAEINPKLVYASSTGFGHRGPHVDRPNLDTVTLAASGNMTLHGGPDAQPVDNTGIADQMAAVWLAFGTLGGLLARERQGVGQEIFSSGLGSMINLQSYALWTRLITGRSPVAHARSDAPNPLLNWYRCREGRWIALCLAQADRYWPTLCRALELAELERDPRFESAQARERNREALIAILDERFAARTYDEWDSRFQETGDLIYTRINHIEDLESDPQVLANDYIVEWEHPRGDAIRVPGFPVQFSRTPQTLRRGAPELGEHTQEVLLELGYGAEDIEGFVAEGIAG